ncbi:unnamed protein product, partial [Dovyalis caffra]
IPSISTLAPSMVSNSSHNLLLTPSQSSSQDQTHRPHPVSILSVSSSYTNTTKSSHPNSQKSLSLSKTISSIREIIVVADNTTHQAPITISSPQRPNPAPQRTHPTTLR